MKSEKKVNNPMNDVNCDTYNAIGFPFDVVSIYTNSEEIPVTRSYMHSVQCCRGIAELIFALKSSRL